MKTFNVRRAGKMRSIENNGGKLTPRHQAPHIPLTRHGPPIPPPESAATSRKIETQTIARLPVSTVGPRNPSSADVPGDFPASAPPPRSPGQYRAARRKRGNNANLEKRETPWAGPQCDRRPTQFYKRAALGRPLPCPTLKSAAATEQRPE